MTRRGGFGRSVLGVCVRRWMVAAGLLLLTPGCSGGAGEQGESASAGSSVTTSEPVPAETVSVEYFGGCGTCGRFHEDGGSVKVDVVDGSVVRLDVGVATAVS